MTEVKPVVIHLVDSYKVFRGVAALLKTNMITGDDASNLLSGRGKSFCGAASDTGMVVPVTEYLEGDIHFLGAETAVCQECLDSEEFALYMLGNTGEF